MPCDCPPPTPTPMELPHLSKKAIIVRSYIQRWFEYNWRAAIKENSRLKNHFEILPLLITRSLGPATQWLRQPPFNIHQSHQTFFARRRFLTNLIIPILPELKYKEDYPNCTIIYSPPMKSFVLFFHKETLACY